MKKLKYLMKPMNSIGKKFYDDLEEYDDTQVREEVQEEVQTDEALCRELRRHLKRQFHWD